MRLLWSSALVAMLAGCATGHQLSSPSSPPPPLEQSAPWPPPPQTSAAVTEDPSLGPPPSVPSGPSVSEPLATAAPKEKPVAEHPLSAAELAALNDERLLDVYPGLSRRVVEHLMDVRQAGRPLNPFRREWLRDADGRLYEVLYYLTRAPLKNRAVRQRDLTPVIFLDDKVHAIGHYPLKTLKRSACVVVTATAPCLSQR